MSKTLISVLVLVVVVVGGYLIIKNGKGVETTPAVETTELSGYEDVNTDGKKMAFSEFIKQGGSYKCEVSQAMSDFPNSGTVYIDGANIRGDFSTVAEGITMTTSIITKDDYTYIWINGPNGLPASGFKTKIESDETTGSGGFNWNPETIGDYNCEGWTSDKVIFAIPTNITFKTQSQ